MTREEIMKGLECCQTKFCKKCNECPYEIFKSHYISTISCSSLMMADALVLMKELLKEN